jgi:hypothetical protein
VLSINLFRSALHISGDKFAHHQEHFLTAYTVNNAPTLLLTIDTAETMSPVGSSVDALCQKLYIQSKSAPEEGRICCPKQVGLI